MGLFSKSEGERAAEQAAIDAKRAEETQRFRERERLTEWASLSPVEKAQAAFERGDRFLQLEMPHATVTGSAGTFLTPSNSGAIRPTGGGSNDILGQIEETGWHLEHASWVFIETGQSSRNRALASGQTVVVNGEVVGLYLFRRNPAARA